MKTQAWTGSALCTQVSLDFFFPSKNEEDEGLLDLARETCRLCPVQPQCAGYALGLEWGDRARDRFGIWAGMGPHARWRAEQQMRAQGQLPPRIENHPRHHSDNFDDGDDSGDDLGDVQHDDEGGST